MKKLILILLCGFMVICSFFTLRKITVYAEENIGVVENLLDNKEKMFNDLQNDMQIYGGGTGGSFIGGATSGDPSYVEESEKLIDNSDLLTTMNIFPKHDDNNGCGMVAMSILMQFYNKLPTKNKGLYIPDNMNYDKGVDTPDKQARANALRDYFDEVTLEIGFGNASFPPAHCDALSSYFDDFCPNIEPTIRGKTHLESIYAQDIINLLDRNIPVLLTTCGATTDTGINVGRHVIVVYGYQITSDALYFISHLGWYLDDNNTSTIMYNHAKV